LTSSSVGSRIDQIIHEDLGKPGFRNIRRRLVTSVHLTDIKQVLQLLGERIHERVELNIAGSVPTLVHGLTARPTDDIDIVDEVPRAIREQRKLLDKIKSDFGLGFGHVQSHYLPARWEQRREYLGDFGGIRAYLLDPYDIFVSKLSSKLEKHQQDLRVLAKAFDPVTARERLLRDGKAFLDDRRSKAQIEKTWQFIFQEPLFPEDRKAKSKEPGARPSRKRKRS
jgi:hypothetical protein